MKKPATDSTLSGELNPWKSPFGLLVVLLFLVSCSESQFGEEYISDQLSLLAKAQSEKYGKIGISDAAHDGIDEFYFLAPTVAEDPEFTGKFHGGLAPVVEISDDFEFRNVHQVFARDGSGGNKISVNGADQKYTLNWNTSISKAVQGKIYRVRVRVGEKVLGFADVGIVPTKAVKLAGDLIPLLQNETLKIAFRIEKKICPARIEVIPDEFMLPVGEEKQFGAVVYNYYDEVLKDPTIQWSVEEQSIASVDSDGLAKGIKAGETKIFAKVNDVIGSASLTVGEEMEPLVDERDGQSYKTVKIGDQIWMAENLNYGNEGSYCYENNPDNCDPTMYDYGRLYDWEAAQTACPAGWHLPSNQEWEQMADHLGGVLIAGGKMKTTTRWNPPNLGATNESGFSGRPAGIRYSDGFIGLRDITLYWSATQDDFEPDFFLGYLLYTHSPELTKSYYATSIGVSFSCRCVQDL